MNRETSQGISRRGFMAVAGTAGAALATGMGTLKALAQEAGKKKIPIALQLYSVRVECSKDNGKACDKVIEEVGKMGYKGVEFAGYYAYGSNAAGLRKLLDNCGLKCCGTHTGLNTLEGDALKKTIEFNKTIGNKFLIVPSLPKMTTKQNWLDMAKKFNEISDKVKGEGMIVGYHNHSVEFAPLEGEMPWDTFFGNTRPEVVMQVDTGNCIAGKGDPVSFIKKYPGRALTVHLKESGGAKDAVIGGGDVKWKEFFECCETVGKTEWYIVEHERGGKDPVGDVKKCLEALKGMGKV